jgi:hypothetical protein
MNWGGTRRRVISEIFVTRVERINQVFSRVSVAIETIVRKVWVRWEVGIGFIYVVPDIGNGCGYGFVVEFSA